MPPFLLLLSSILAALLAGAAVLHLIPKLGARSLSAALCRAPGLDIVITYFTAAPLFVGPIVGDRMGIGAGQGLCAALAAQVLTVMLWTVAHEAANRKHLKGPRIVKSLNAAVGRVRNHAAVWVTALAVPLFWLVRLAQYVVYPPLTWLVRLPRYNQAEWVNVSRHKFSGLVGHDLIWCLYCDWMTGIWSLGSEMLRNVESFWCPIRFDSSKKCENCKIDFPDVEGGWAPADGTMADVARVLETHYRKGDTVNPWFGHPVRLTVEGREMAPG